MNETCAWRGGWTNPRCGKPGVYEAVYDEACECPAAIIYCLEHGDVVRQRCERFGGYGSCYCEVGAYVVGLQGIRGAA